MNVNSARLDNDAEVSDAVLGDIESNLFWHRERSSRVTSGDVDTSDGGAFNAKVIASACCAKCQLHYRPLHREFLDAQEQFITGHLGTRSRIPNSFGEFDLLASTFNIAFQYKWNLASSSEQHHGFNSLKSGRNGLNRAFLFIQEECQLCTSKLLEMYKSPKGPKMEEGNFSVNSVTAPCAFEFEIKISDFKYLGKEGSSYPESQSEITHSSSPRPSTTVIVSATSP
ncbi:unnamed protein product [Acanthocheilonema viteae]|uniref:Uncharacterized protein n=1 Tax=Acanthocheilonema viteae TaxID=6277 RepID=A0A498S341_ACAVI|nr:unnamed protein product [Acanthocheilonema viteae]